MQDHHAEGPQLAGETGWDLTASASTVRAVTERTIPHQMSQRCSGKRQEVTVKVQPGKFCQVVKKTHGSDKTGAALVQGPVWS